MADVPSGLVSLEEASHFPTAHDGQAYVHENEIRRLRTCQESPFSPSSAVTTV